MIYNPRCVAIESPPPVSIPAGVQAPAECAVLSDGSDKSDKSDGSDALHKRTGLDSTRHPKDARSIGIGRGTKCQRPRVTCDTPYLSDPDRVSLLQTISIPSDPWRG